MFVVMSWMLNDIAGNISWGAGKGCLDAMGSTLILSALCSCRPFMPVGTPQGYASPADGCRRIWWPLTAVTGCTVIARGSDTESIPPLVPIDCAWVWASAVSAMGWAEAKVGRWTASWNLIPLCCWRQKGSLEHFISPRNGESSPRKCLVQ